MPAPRRGTTVKQTWESEMKTVIVLALVAIAASQLNTATARSLAEPAPTGELIYYPQYSFAPDTFTWLICDSLEG